MPMIRDRGRRSNTPSRAQTSSAASRTWSRTFRASSSTSTSCSPMTSGCSLPVYIGPQVEQLLGYPREAWLTEDELWLDVLHPDDRERMIAADIAARSALAPHFAEYRMIARDGRVVWVSEKAVVVTDEVTGTIYWQGVMVDITDRKLAEEALAASERQYRSIFDAATIGLMTVDLEGRVLEANGVVEQVLGHPAGSLAGASLITDLEAGDETQRRIEALAAGSEDQIRARAPPAGP